MNVTKTDLQGAALKAAKDAGQTASAQFAREATASSDKWAGSEALREFIREDGGQQLLLEKPASRAAPVKSQGDDAPMKDDEALVRAVIQGAAAGAAAALSAPGVSTRKTDIRKTR